MKKINKTNKMIESFTMIIYDWYIIQIENLLFVEEKLIVFVVCASGGDVRIREKLMILLWKNHRD